MAPTTSTSVDVRSAGSGIGTFSRKAAYHACISGGVGSAKLPDWMRWMSGVISATSIASTVIAGPTMMTKASTVVAPAARALPMRPSRRACTGFSTIANTAAQPSGARNGATILRAR